MSESCNSCWRNCAFEADDEMRSIDALGDLIAPTPPEISRIRKLISSLELCHHKAERWVDNILEAIANGATTKGLGKRPTGQVHRAERTWQDVCNVLSKWCSSDVSSPVEAYIGAIPTAKLLAGLGEPSPLKKWQVQRVIERIQSVLDWSRSEDHPATNYEWILLSGGDYEVAYRKDCPAPYQDQKHFWLATVQTKIHDTDHGQASELSLGLAIDMLWPCNWNFMANLQIVLNAIGGQLQPDRPFAACGRNISLIPNQERMRKIASTLKAFCSEAAAGETDPTILELLGEPTQEKCWLAASLAQTIQLQLDPPAAMLEASSLEGPEWINERTQ